MYRALSGRVTVWTIGLAVLGSAVLLAIGCAKSYRTETDQRDDGTTTHTLANLEIKVEGATKYFGFEEGSSTVEKQCVFDVRAYDRPGQRRTFELLLTYRGAEAMNIEPGRSLEIVADLNSYVLSAGSGPTRTRDPSGKFFTESLAYPIAGDVLVTMAEAQTVEVIVKGPSEDAKGSFDEKSFGEFRRFVDEFVRPQ